MATRRSSRTFSRDNKKQIQTALENEENELVGLLGSNVPNTQNIKTPFLPNAGIENNGNYGCSVRSIVKYIFILFIGIYIGMMLDINQDWKIFHLQPEISDYSTIVSGQFTNSSLADKSNEMKTGQKAKKQRAFTDAQIKQLYATYIQPKESDQAYLEKYQWLSNATWLPKEFDPSYFIGNNSAKWKADISRVIQTASFSEYVSKYSLTDSSNCYNTLTLEVGVDPEIQYFNGYFGKSKCENFTCLDYTGSGRQTSSSAKIDLYTLDLDFKEWDIILLPQFLEHFYAPSIIMDNLFEHLKEGGFLYTSTPTINLPHMKPIHFQHFEPMGLLMLAVQSGFDVLEFDFWGHRVYIETIFRNHWWSHYKSHEFVDAEPMINDPVCVSQVWGLFQKPIQ